MKRDNLLNERHNHMYMKLHHDKKTISTKFDNINNVNEIVKINKNVHHNNDLEYIRKQLNMKHRPHSDTHTHAHTHTHHHPHPYSKYTMSSSDLISHQKSIDMTSLSTNDKKYFIEYGYNYQQDQHLIPGGQHYDSLYYKKSLQAEESLIILKQLFLSWLSFLTTITTDNNNKNNDNNNNIIIQSWLAHGTLIGWYWGGGILPWDDDLDIQISVDDLDKLFKIR